MLTHRGFSAWIHSEGAPVPEYLVSMPDAKNCVNCWIPGKPGSKFTVFWQDETNSGIASCSYINIDGTHVPGKFLHGSGFSAKSGVRISKDAERPFVFEAVMDDARDTAASSAKMGTITLEIKRVVLLGTRPSDSAESSTIPKTILEKPKAGQICVGLGQEVVLAQQSPMTYQIAPYPKPAGDGPYPKPSTYVTFKFKYRTLEWLQQQDIATEANVSSSASLIRVPAPVPIKVEDSPQISSKRAREASTTPPSPTASAPPRKKLKSTHQEQVNASDLSSSSISVGHIEFASQPGSSSSAGYPEFRMPTTSTPSGGTSNNVIDLTPASEAEQKMSLPKSRKPSKARGKARIGSDSNSRKTSATMSMSASTSTIPSTSAIPSSSSATSEFNSTSLMLDHSLLPPGAFASMSNADFDALFPNLSAEATDNHSLSLPDGSLSDITTPSPSF
ncbi:hypothetical protein D9619_005912 [Psilocybe cf. subviscida]|uniref:DUF7918 domain-containing protein n=1 Tax=Psilocybe cf. subviscida TaxID=2480587 RepID=A0A8H5BWD4_9AGAR|nr:hypothetical protein D9619_005912 [Psilocybe cf. subviscida]